MASDDGRATRAAPLIVPEIPAYALDDTRRLLVVPSERSIYIAHFTGDRANTELKGLRERLRLCRATGSRIHNRLSGKPRLTTESQ